MKKLRKFRKDFLLAAIIIAAVLFIVQGTKFQSSEEYYRTHIDDITAETPTVTVSIICTNILKNYDSLPKELRSEKYVPKSGVILAPTKVRLREGDSVFDILCRVTREKQIQLDYNDASVGSYNSAYIKGINFLYEYTCGPLSGWTYTVNDSHPDYGCSQYILADGDDIKWQYTCDLGRDVGFTFEEQVEKN